MFLAITFEPVEIIGFMAGICLAGSALPQLIKSIKTKDVSGISLLMLLLIMSGSLLWLTYGIIVKSISMIICNSIQSACYIMIVSIKLLSIIRGKKEKKLEE